MEVRYARVGYVNILTGKAMYGALMRFEEAKRFVESSYFRDDCFYRFLAPYERDDMLKEG